MGGLLKQQNDVSLQRGMPVDPVSDSQKVVSQSEASVQLYYYNSGVLTVDAGQAAGVNVVAKLTYAAVLTNIGDVIATKNDHSLAFTSTAFTTEKDINFDVMENSDLSAGVDKLNAIVDGFANGEYCVDYRTGTIYGKKASTQTALTTVTYKTSTTAANVTLEASDIQIGAVELKDGTSDARATVNAANTARTSTTTTVVSQPVDANGVIISNSYIPKADYESPEDFTATYTSTSTITLTGVPFTLASSAKVVYVKVTDTSSKLTATYVNGIAGYSFDYSAGVITSYLNGVAATIFASTNVYEVGLNSQIKSYDPTLDITKTVNQSPDRSSYVQDSLVDTTNIAAGTSYYPSTLGMSMDGFKDLSLSGKIIEGDAVTDTIEVQATNDEDTTNADWVTIYGYRGDTNTFVNIITTGGVAGTYTFTLDFDNLNYSFFRIKLVTADATNTVIIKSRRKSL